MAELKTKKTKESPVKFINSLTDDKRRADAKVLLTLFKEATGENPFMWGSSIIGYGTYHYKSQRSRQEGDWPRVGFSPRKQNLTLYILPNLKEVKPLLKKLGKHKTTVGCLYINKIEDVDLRILKKIIILSWKEMNKRYPIG